MRWRLALLLLVVGVSACERTELVFIETPPLPAQARAAILTILAPEPIVIAAALPLDNPLQLQDVGALGRGVRVSASAYDCSLEAMGLSEGRLQQGEGVPLPAATQEFLLESLQSDWVEVPGRPAAFEGVRVSRPTGALCPRFRIMPMQAPQPYETVLQAVPLDDSHTLLVTTSSTALIVGPGTIEQVQLPLAHPIGAYGSRDDLLVLSLEGGFMRGALGGAFESLPSVQPSFTNARAVLLGDVGPSLFPLFAAVHRDRLLRFDGSAWSVLAEGPGPGGGLVPTPASRAGADRIAAIGYDASEREIVLQAAVGPALPEFVGVPQDGPLTAVSYGERSGLLVGTEAGVVYRRSQEGRWVPRLPAPSGVDVRVLAPVDEGFLYGGVAGLLELWTPLSGACDQITVQGSKLNHLLKRDGGFLAVGDSTEWIVRMERLNPRELCTFP